MNIKYFIMSIFSRKCNLFTDFETLACFLYFQNCGFQKHSHFLSTLAMNWFYIFFRYIPLRRQSQQEYTGKLVFSYRLHNKNDNNANILHLGSTCLFFEGLKFLSFNLASLILCEDGIKNIFTSILQLGRPVIDVIDFSNSTLE